jgi:hypothetical protein
MATVEQFIDDARYDLRDYQVGLEFDDEELLVYINRMRKSLDSMLTSLNSSFVQAEDSTNVILLDGDNSVSIATALNSGNWDSIREVWIGQNRLEKISLDLLYYKRIYRTDEAEPQFWAHHGDLIEFEGDADQNYTLRIRYNKTTPILTYTDAMPYSDTFNEIFRELIVMHAKAKKEGQMAPTEQAYQALFRQIAFQQQIRTDFKPKYYHLGF